MAQNALNTFRIPSPTDLQIVKFFFELIGIFPGSPLSVFVAGVNIGAPKSLDEFIESEQNADWDTTRVVTRVSYTINTGGTPETIVAFTRSLMNGHGASAEPSPWEAEIYVAATSGPPDAVLTKQIALQIAAFQNSVSGKARALVSTSGPDMREVFAKELSELARVQRELIEESSGARIAADVAYDSRRKKLESEFEDYREKAEAEFEAARDALKLQSEALLRREKELDDRAHMHVRRQLRSEITNELKERLARPQTPPSVIQGRFLFFGFGTILLCITIGYGIYAALDIQSILHIQESEARLNVKIDSPFENTVLIVSAVRFSLAAALSAGLGYYLLNWLRQIQAEDLRVERDLERYRYDLDRASWAIETILEAHEKGEAAVPSEWISGVTRGLFSRSEARHSDPNALEALGSLLNVAAEAELGPQGPKIRIKKPGIKRLAKTTSPE